MSTAATTATMRATAPPAMIALEAGRFLGLVDMTPRVGRHARGPAPWIGSPGPGKRCGRPARPAVGHHNAGPRVCAVRPWRGEAVRDGAAAAPPARAGPPPGSSACRRAWAGPPRATVLRDDRALVAAGPARDRRPAPGGCGVDPADPAGCGRPPGSSRAAPAHGRVLRRPRRARRRAALRHRALRHDPVLDPHGPAPAAAPRRGAAGRPLGAGHAAAPGGVAGVADPDPGRLPLGPGRGARAPGRCLGPLHRDHVGEPLLAAVRPGPRE